MTCIVAVKDGKNLWIGGDSAASSPPPSTEIYLVAAPKVFAIGEFLVGYTMSFRAGQVLKHEVTWPKLDAGADLERILVRQLVPEWRRALREAGALKTTEGIDQGAHFLIGLRGELFSVGLDFSVTALAEEYLAIGSGRHHAYGTLYGLGGVEMPAEARIVKALEAAARFSCNVRAPFSVITDA